MLVWFVVSVDAPYVCRTSVDKVNTSFKSYSQVREGLNGAVKRRYKAADEKRMRERLRNICSTVDRLEEELMSRKGVYEQLLMKRLRNGKLHHLSANQGSFLNI